MINVESILNKLNIKIKNKVSFILGFSAFIYLSGNLVVRGGWAELPIILISIIILIFYKKIKIKNDISSEYKIKMAYGLCLFGTFNALMIWFHGANISLYEAYIKFILASIVALALFKNPISSYWVRWGIIISGFSLIYVLIFNNSGEQRFSNYMNPNKWSVILACYGCSAYWYLFKSKGSEAILLLIVFIAFACGILITESRGPLLALALVVFFMTFMNAKKILKSKKFFFTLISLSFLILLNSDMITKRSEQVVQQIQAYQSGSFKSSIGTRLLLWEMGLKSIQNTPLYGSGYELKESTAEYIAQNKKMEAVDFVRKVYGSFHNIYIDSLITQGFLGFFAIIFFLYYMLSVGIKLGGLVLIPLWVIIISGLFDSVLYMSIVTGQLSLSMVIYANQIYDNEV